jgi:hypothetical protein
MGTCVVAYVPNNDVDIHVPGTTETYIRSVTNTIACIIHSTSCIIWSCDGCG